MQVKCYRMISVLVGIRKSLNQSLQVTVNLALAFIIIFRVITARAGMKSKLFFMSICQKE